MKVRADQLLVTRGLAPTRAKAQALILAGKVHVGETRIDKAGTTLPEDANIVVRGEDHPYVSRGGVKLAGALDTFGVDPQGKRCIDLGASTGGFTDCLLQRGAVYVAAVDVGYGQLAHKLRVDPRVLCLERTNARTLEPAQVGGLADLVVVDASFIGLGKLTEAIARCLLPGGELVALVKPQFEVGREEASKSRGVVRDPEVRARAIGDAIDDVKAAGLEVLGTCDSSLPGPKGNLEAFVHARKKLC
ncbi:RNA binding methyltransferase FtsJ like protein [Labilithrix luteola]|uniref:RNA binding methyltransferase FtsJ like protein n=1 Tax=Labilithrix luteola TaxID=1391654 RepID=A0A0K1PTD5_9BACT|nr:TlyA family RNA methyltransferase [Labilithrix luteola]AKU96798.1 RNA binding methyltransferase FtsJ like protein [Labilithrix luteola]